MHFYYEHWPLSAIGVTPIAGYTLSNSPSPSGRSCSIVNRYPVYNADIKPKGFEFIELDGFVNSTSVQETKELLKSPERVRTMTERNFQIALENFSLQVLEDKLKELLSNF